jgi:hypothetical protein
VLDERGVEHRDCGFLEGDVGSAVEVAAAGAEGGDKFFGADDPADAPTGQAETLSQAVDKDDVVGVDVDDVGGGGDGGAVAVSAVVVPGVEFVEDECCAICWKESQIYYPLGMREPGGVCDLPRQMSWILISSSGARAWPVGFRGFEVRITEVPRANSSATLSAWMWYPSAAESGLGTATNWWKYVSTVLQ